MQRIFQQDKFPNPAWYMNAQVFALAQGRARQPGLLKQFTENHRLGSRDADTHSPTLRQRGCNIPATAMHYGNALHHPQTAGNMQSGG